MTGIEVFLMVIGAFALISISIAVGLSIFQWICLPIAAFITQVRTYAAERDTRLGDRGA